MENGDSNASQEVETPNGEIQLAEDDTDTEPVTHAKLETIPVKVNGDTTDRNSSNELDSSDCDALVIDESVNVKKSKVKKKQKLKGGFRGFSKAKQKTDILTRKNPLFTESLNELSELLKESSSCKYRKLTKTKAGNPKLREYAQYLGLQPAVQFKCPKCTRSGFDSLPALNDHHMHCKAEAPAVTPPQPQSNPPSSTLRVSRKVYLCSACGTYYENWNLFLHMREVHRRFICLYCLGMFSDSEKLAQHLVVKHSCIPNRRNSVEDFFSLYKEPCFLMCCSCERVFSERDNFFTHECVRRDLPKKSISKVNNQRNKPECVPQNGAFIQTDQKIPSPHNSNPETTEELSLLSSEGQNEQTKPNEEPQPEEPEEYDDEEDVTKEEDAPDGEEDEGGGEEGAESEGDLPQEIKTMEDDQSQPSPVEETRKVPKVTLKLSKSGSYPELIQDNNNDDSTDSIRPMDVEQPEPTNEPAADQLTSPTPASSSSELQVAGPDIGIVELALEQPLDKFEMRLLLRKCLTATAPTCIYCNHARRIAVCGKQLGLHAIAEHRFAGVVNSITAEELIPESFVARISEGLADVDGVYFSLEESDSGEEGMTFPHVFECFQCRFSTGVHKELYLHNRKSHAKTILLCIMCKSNFYSYSELICHLCPGVYALDSDIHFRCCLCVSDNLPSAFRLMVHLRKKHNVCDVCLEFCHNQSKLSNHVWKHKLHHLCYRCGIAYRNKPDITKHLFWKHGTESVLCKKCLQKKWPHVYHFCIPPASFLCEECNLTFTKAVSLKVHKRTHSDTKPHKCAFEGCTEAFISKKLLLKHEFKHREPQEEPKPIEEPEITQENSATNPDEAKTEKEDEHKEEEKIEKPKPKVDVYDLPALNLSESDSSDSEDEAKKTVEKPPETTPEEKPNENSTAPSDVEVPEKPVTILENVWDDFKNYQANMGKLITEPKEQEQEQTAPVQEETTNEHLLDIIMMDHDYCNPQPETVDELNELPANLEPASSMDHDYFSSEVAEPEAPKEEPKRPQSSSSDSDSSSCTCGSNCSCSSTSGSSSSTSDSSDSDSSTSEGRRRQQARRERRKEKSKGKVVGEGEGGEEKNPVLDVVATTVVQESDLETTESETDEDFYDEQPQKLANQMIAEKRNQLIAELEPVVNGGHPQDVSLPEEVKQKKKAKSKKRKKKKAKRNPSHFYQTPTVAPITLSIPRNSPVSIPPEAIATIAPDLINSTDPDHLRASKRRRVPNKFYGYSSDEENDKHQHPKWRKSSDPRHSPLVVPPITIKTVAHLEQPSELRIQQRPPENVVPPASDTDSSEEEEEEEEAEPTPLPAPLPPPRPNQPALYCYCRCPYDEVSEMIGCDSSECAIEWFHFECVGIMVPPKGQWFCPDCRKKKQQKRDLLQLQQT